MMIIDFFSHEAVNERLTSYAARLQRLAIAPVTFAKAVSCMLGAHISQKPFQELPFYHPHRSSNSTTHSSSRQRSSKPSDASN